MLPNYVTQAHAASGKGLSLNLKADQSLPRPILVITFLNCPFLWLPLNTKAIRPCHIKMGTMQTVRINYLIKKFAERLVMEYGPSPG